MSLFPARSFLEARPANGEVPLPVAEHLHCLLAADRFRQGEPRLHVEELVEREQQRLRSRQV